MIVYVKECQYVSLKDIVTWIKNGIAVQPFKSKADVRENDVVIMSNRDEDTDIRLTMNNVLIYEDFFEKVSSSIIQEFCYNHDYYYLKNALSRAKESDITTLISGSSYGVLGIDPSYIENTVNLSSISQDLYYSSSLVKGACATNLNIKNIVFCVGYYYFFTDLSRTQNQDEILRISKVYKPLLMTSIIVYYFHHVIKCFMRAIYLILKKFLTYIPGENIQKDFLIRTDKEKILLQKNGMINQKVGRS